MYSNSVRIITTNNFLIRQIYEVSSMKRLYLLYLHYSGNRFMLFLLLLVRHGSCVAVPFVFGALIALLTAGEITGKLVWTYVGGMVLLNGMSVLADYLYHCQVAQETSRMAAQIKVVALQRFHGLDYETREGVSVGAWEQRICGDPQAVAGCSCPVFSDLHGAVVIFVLTTGIMLWGQPLFLLPVVVITLLFRVVYQVNRRALLKRSREMRECGYCERETLLDTLSLTPIMRLFRVVPFLSHRYNQASVDCRDAEIASAVTSAGYTGQIRGLMWLSGAAVLMLSLVLYAYGIIGIAEVVAYDLLVGQISGQLGQLIFCIPMLTRGAESAAALEDAFGNLTKPLESSDRKEHALVASDHLLQLEQVSFRYRNGEHDILCGMDWTLEQGQYVSILGKNGEGKSTLIKLLLGELQPTAGQVRGMVKRPGYVPQASAVFRGSLLENITLCNKSIPRGKVEEIVKLTRLQGLAGRIGGLDGEISREQISGGELQRIGIARALLIEPDLLVVDEITNNLDIANKALIFRVLQEMKTRCSIISISHDIESLADSDECKLLVDGKLHTIVGDTAQERRDFAYNMIVRRYEYA